ncbi:hypothetical protein ACHAWU_007481 [Discostella pseudostelligera]|uniref:Uncharacterized protein n=1 Tax=Discostella pseudostelligera TaxID=259834 RepID=A0ABD3MWV4_9STRA
MLVSIGPDDFTSTSSRTKRGLVIEGARFGLCQRCFSKGVTRKLSRKVIDTALATKKHWTILVVSFRRLIVQPLGCKSEGGNDNKCKNN